MGGPCHEDQESRIQFLFIEETRLAGDTKAEIGSILGRCGFPAIYNFGDSNSDTGAISAAAREVLPPNAENLQLLSLILAWTCLEQILGVVPILQLVAHPFIQAAIALFVLQAYQFIHFKTHSTALYNRLILNN
ncbi:GDSL esterase/lipase At3g27950-like isoform X2 [Carica papaya]|uniref:GDSL esterase/lipase At3g27950-like isoform X2 n=1 Tax=Carica papaya TaxID=3649 RepID=UPI000B8C92D8|nr:GDSL esterase/lipase At3g27950-like isoform X2 [Carica papaya]